MGVRASELSRLRVGYFGSSTGAAAALAAGWFTRFLGSTLEAEARP